MTSIDAALVVITHRILMKRGVLSMRALVGAGALAAAGCFVSWNQGSLSWMIPGLAISSAESNQANATIKGGLHALNESEAELQLVQVVFR